MYFFFFFIIEEKFVRKIRLHFPKGVRECAGHYHQAQPRDSRTLVDGGAQSRAKTGRQLSVHRAPSWRCVSLSLPARFGF